MYERPPYEPSYRYQEELTVRNWHAPAFDPPETVARPAPPRRPAPASRRPDLLALARERADAMLHDARREAARLHDEGWQAGLQLGLAEGEAAAREAVAAEWEALRERARAGFEAECARSRRRAAEFAEALLEELGGVVSSALGVLMGPEGAALAGSASGRLREDVEAALRLDEAPLREELERRLRP